MFFILPAYRRSAARRDVVNTCIVRSGAQRHDLPGHTAAAL